MPSIMSTRIHSTKPSLLPLENMLESNSDRDSLAKALLTVFRSHSLVELATDDISKSDQTEFSLSSLNLEKLNRADQADLARIVQALAECIINRIERLIPNTMEAVELRDMAAWSNEIRKIKNLNLALRELTKKFPMQCPAPSIIKHG